MPISTTDILLGYGSALGFALESAYDDGTSPATWLPLISWSPNEEYPQVPRPHLHGGTGRVATGYFTERHDIGATFKVEASYAAIGTFLRAAMGPAPTTTGSGPYTHPFLLGNVLPSMALRAYLGESATGTITERYQDISGALVNRMTLSIRAGEVATIECEVIGKTSARGNPGSPSITYPEPVLYHQAGNISWNSASYDGNALELTINNGLARRRNIGNLKTARPHPSTLREIMVALTRDYCDDTLIAALTAQTESDLTVTMTGTSGSLALELHSARVRSPITVGIAEGGFGAMPETIEFVPRNVPGGTDYGLAITLVNANASYLT